MFSLAGALVASAYIVITPAVYQSEVFIRIDPRPLRVPRRDASSKALHENQTAIAVLESQVQIIKSTPILSAVVVSLALNRDREFGGEDESFVERVRAALSGPTGSSPLHGLEPSDAERCQVAISSGAICSDVAVRAALSNLQRAVRIRRMPGGYVIAVRASSQSPDKASRIADAVANGYLSAIRRSDAETLKKASREVAQGIAKLDEAVKSDGDEINRIRRKIGIVEGARGTVDEQQLAETSRQLLGARIQLQDLLTRCEYLKKLARTSSGLDAEEFPDFPVLEALRLKQAALAVQEEGLRAKLGPRHPDVARMAEQRRRIRALIRQELDRTAESECNDLARAQSTEAALSVRVNALETKSLAASASAVELRERMRLEVISGKALETALRRTTELEQGSAVSLENVRVLGPAEEPRVPLTSRIRLMVTTAFVGIIAGAAWLIIRAPLSRVPVANINAREGLY